MRCAFSKSHFTLSTASSYQIYKTSTLSLVASRRLAGGSDSILKTLLYQNSNLVITATPSMITLYDHATNTIYCSIEFQSIHTVRNIFVEEDYLFVIFEANVWVYSMFEGVKRVFSFECGSNLRGLGATGGRKSCSFLAVPARQTGQVQFITLSPTRKPTSSLILAHKSKIGRLCLNSDGTLLATASELGTLIRLFITRDTPALLHEFRRGSDPACIHDIAFDPTGVYVCVSSDKDTLHIFRMGSRTSFAKFGGVRGSGCGSVTFLDGKVVCVYGDGACYVLSWDAAKGGRCVKELFRILSKGSKKDSLSQAADSSSAGGEFQ